MTFKKLRDKMIEVFRSQRDIHKEQACDSTKYHFSINKDIYDNLVRFPYSHYIRTDGHEILFWRDTEQKEDIVLHQTYVYDINTSGYFNDVSIIYNGREFSIEVAGDYHAYQAPLNPIIDWLKKHEPEALK